MPPPRFLSMFLQSTRRDAHRGNSPSQVSFASLNDFTSDAPSHRVHLPWIASPIDETSRRPRFFRHSDATPIELFFDLFFVANLSTFTATHEINNGNALIAYIGFLGVIWFTWLQITLFDIRFARDSVFERICKAIQLAAMVGFASAGTRFTTPLVLDENLWAFQSLSLFLAGSRILLATQYLVNAMLIYSSMRTAASGILYTAVLFMVTSFLYVVMFFAFRPSNGLRGTIWVIWFFIFAVELWGVIGLSDLFPEIWFQDTHINVRIGLLTLIIIGEGVISITRIVNMTVRPGGWTKWSFVHILGVTTSVYLLWQVYYDISPRCRLHILAQSWWTQLHFPFHVALILLLEGSQILALTLDVTLKLKYLRETLFFVCEEPRLSAEQGLGLIQSTISDMEIPFSRGATQAWASISSILEDLSHQSLCPEPNTTSSFYTEDLFSDLVGNVTAALFSSMGITPSKEVDISLLDSEQLLQMYMALLGFVYVYFFALATISMVLLAVFSVLSRRHERRLYLGFSMGMRILLCVLLASLISFASHFSLAYSFMTSPVILYAFTFTLLTVLLFDRLLDYLACRDSAAGRRNRERNARRWESSGPGTVAIELEPVAEADADQRVSLSRGDEVSVQAVSPPAYSPQAEDDQAGVQEQPGVPSPSPETPAGPVVSGGASVLSLSVDERDSA